MKQIIQYVKNDAFWNTLFKILLLVILGGIFFVLANISDALKGSNTSEKNEISKEWKNEKKEEKIKKEEKNEKNEKQQEKDESTDKKIIGEKEEEKSEIKEASSGWTFWKKEEPKNQEVSAPKKQDPTNIYAFKCDEGKILKVYEGMYDIRGQKSILNSGEVALDDPISERIHLLTKTDEKAGKAIYEKVVTRLENGKKLSYTYILTTFSNGEATFTKNGIQTYKNCHIKK